MLDEIFDDVARKHKLSVEQVKLIYQSTFLGVRYYLSNPLVSKATVKLPGLGRFIMIDRSIRNYWKEHMVPELQDYKKQFQRKKK